MAPLFSNKYHLFMSKPAKGSMNFTTFSDVLHRDFWMVILAFLIALTGVLYLVVSVEEVIN